MAATLIELRRRTLVMLNDLFNETTVTGELYTNTAVNRTINDCMLYYAKIINSFYQGYLSSTISINLVANQTTYALGSTFRSPIYSVRRTIQNEIFNLFPFQNYLGVNTTDAVPNNTYLPTYQLEGNNIVFSAPPTDNEVGGVVVRFQKKLVELAADASILDDELYDAEDCIIIRSAVRLLRGKDVSGGLKNSNGWVQELQDAEKAFYLQAGNRYVKQDVPIPRPAEDYAYL